MPSARTCPECGAALPGDAPKGFCPKCLIRLGAGSLPACPGSSPAVAASHSTLKCFGDYELLEEIARGGMGVVYKARQVSLNRLVALKMILTGQLASASEVQRFRTEAEAAARLDHPNIVGIHEVGEHEGHQYFSMDYVQGKNLSELVRDHPLPARRAAAWLKTIAEAIHYAHRNGVLHRDLKSSNIVIDQNEQPRVTDFGLAKQLAGDSDLTLSGQVLGSPNFMPPEQACGRRDAIGPASDVYSLGAVLYHVLTGRPPFIAETVSDTLRQLSERDPVSPRLLNANVPRDLETLCLKCLQKDPARRYATAQDLADDLDRFLNHEPVLARPVARGEKFWRWCRRKPAFAAAIGAVVVLLLVVSIGSPIAALRIDRAHRQTQRNLVAQYVANGTRLMNDGDLFGSLLWYTEALRIDAGSPEREEPHRIRIASVLRQCPKLINVFAHGTMVYCANFSPDGNRIVTASDDRTARVWDVDSGQRQLVLQHDDEVFDAAFSPDGQRIITASKDGTARVWDAGSGELLASLKHAGKVWRACFSADSQLVATASNDRTAQLWNAATGRKAGLPFRHEDAVIWVSFSPNGRFLSSVTWDDIGSVWEVATGRLLFYGRHNGSYSEMPFNQDSSRFLTVDGENLRVWDASTFRECSFSPLKHQRAIVQSPAFSPDGRYIVTTANDNTTTVWDAATGEKFLPVIEREDVNLKVAFSPDSRRLLTAGEDKIGRVWSARNGRPLCPPLKHILMVKRCAFNPDGRRLLTYSCDQAGRVWDLATSETLRSPATAPSVTWGTGSGDGRYMLASGTNNTVLITDPVSGQTLSSLPHQFPVTYADLSPDGRTVITGCAENNAVSSTRTAIFLWDAATGRLLNKTAMQTGFALNCATFSADGARVVTGGLDFTAQVWDAVNGKPISGPLRQRHQVLWAAFSPDGQRIVVGCWDNTARVWDVATGQPLTALLQHKNRVCEATWSATGARLDTLTQDGCLQTWDLTTSEPLTPPRRISAPDGRSRGGSLINTEFGDRNTQAGQRLLASAATEEILPDKRPLADLVSLARMLAVGRVDAGGNLVPLELAELRSTWTALRQKYPDQFAATPREIALWHKGEAGECEVDGDWKAALFHLEQAAKADPHDTPLEKRRCELASALPRLVSTNAIKAGLARVIPLRDPNAGVQQVDLSAYYKLALSDSLIGRPDGRDLSPLPTGLQRFDNVLFDIRGVIHPSSESIRRERPDLPEKITGINVRRKCRRLHFLHATSNWVAHDVHVGNYILHYANGEQRELPIIYGRDIGRSWGLPRVRKPGEAVMLWPCDRTLLSGEGLTQRVFKSTRDNPLPDVEVVRIDLLPTRTDCVPFLIALTVE